MRKDVHRAALKAASKVAFSVAFLGCSSAGPDGAPFDDTVAGGDDTSSTESDLKKKAPKDAGPSCHDAAPPDCKAILAATFPGADTYPGKKKKLSSEAASCCVAGLKDFATGFEGTSHRWSCCASIAGTSFDSDDIGTACTPWGPPVPPSMHWRAPGAAEAVA